MNANAFHNILNLIGLVIGALIAFDWTSLGLDPITAAKVAGGVLLADKIIKLVLNVSRDGLNGLFARQPPVIK